MIREVPGAQETADRWCTAHDYTDPGKPKIAWNDEAARAVLVDAPVSDALNLLGRLPEQELGEKAANAVGLLALVGGQDVEPAPDSDGGDGRWRITRGTAADRTVSTVDPDARHVHKNRTRHQDGFKAHASFEPETGLFTAVALTGGHGPDSHEAAVAPGLLEDEDGESTVLGDTAYGTGDLRQSPETEGRTLVIKPPPLRQAVPGGFTTDDFHVDTTTASVTCPAGHTKALGRPLAGGNRQTQFKTLCRACPLRKRCTRSRTGRTFNVHPPVRPPQSRP
ncbi:transposase [Streptomyces virginiae]